MPRWLPVLLFVLAAAASAALTAQFYRPAAQGPADPGSPVTAAQRWLALSNNQRAELIGRYRAIARRSDGAEVLRRARNFESLPLAEQEVLRLIHGEYQDTLSRVPAPRRRMLRTLHERARAEEVYRILAQQTPQRLAELRAQLTAHP